MGWVSCQLFDHQGLLRAGPMELKLWPDDRANPIGAHTSAITDLLLAHCSFLSRSPSQTALLHCWASYWHQIRLLARVEDRMLTRLAVVLFRGGAGTCVGNIGSHDAARLQIRFMRSTFLSTSPPLPP